MDGPAAIESLIQLGLRQPMRREFVATAHCCSLQSLLLISIGPGRMRSLLCLLAVSLLAIGCNAWRSGSTIANWGEDRKIEKQAEHDPFPSPDQVGL